MSTHWLLEPDETECLLSQLLKVEQQWYPQYNLQDTSSELANLLRCLDKVSLSTQPIAADLYKVIDVIYDELLFTSAAFEPIQESNLCSINYGLNFRTGNELSLSIIVAYLLRHLGFKAEVVGVQNELVAVVYFSQSEAIIIDPLTGMTEHVISSDDTNISLVSEMARYIKPLATEELYKIVLSEQKMALLEEGKFQQALACVEALIKAFPEDHYERRERAMLLNELNCTQWAKQELDSFIEDCPNDPMALFLKVQLDEQPTLNHTIH